jgi:2,4-dienoyl-CoA reductase (NADPH2)
MRLLQTRVCQAWEADLTIDNHATNGSVHRFSMTYDVPHTTESGRPEPVLYVRERLLPPVTAALKKNHGREVTVVDSDKRIAGDVMPSFKWRHTAWIEELGIPTRTGARVLAIGAGGVQIRTAQGEEEFLPADTVISAVERRPNQELFHELEWMIDEVHGCGDSLVPRGLTQAIHDGFRLGARI